MLRTLAWRAAVALPTLLVVSALMFAALRLAPADRGAIPSAASDAQPAATHDTTAPDELLPIRYAIWLGRALHGDFGRSSRSHRRVARLVGAALPPTGALAGGGMLAAVFFGAGGGWLLFVLRGRRAEPVLETAATLMMSLPDFLWALLLIAVFGVLVHRLPPGIGLVSGPKRPAEAGGLRAVLPSLALGIAFAPPIARALRTSLRTAWEQENIHQTRLRGLSEGRLLLAHVLPQAAPPVLAVIGTQFALLLGGSLLVELIFAIPGIGSLMAQAVRHADLPVIEAVGLAYGAAVLVVNVVVAALCLILDRRPRRA